jgi:monooxygenase
MASWQARVAAFLVRRRVKPALGDMADIARVRAVFDQPLPEPRGVCYRADVLGGVAGEWVEALAPVGGTATTAATTTVLYVHGGGFVGCSPASHRPLTASLALQGLRLFVPDYRLAPEHPFPAAPDDVLAAWHGLRAAHQAASGSGGRLVLAGDSAGGNLVLSLLLSLRDAGEVLPDAAALFSPATDLSGGSPSLYDNAQRDPMFAGTALHHLADAYLAGAAATDPRASPLLADLHGLPPLLLQVGEDESLRDDSLRLADKARAAGVTVLLRVVPVVHHVWPMLWRLPESREAVRLAAQFLHSAMPAPVPESQRVAESFDVLIVGAGLSGIGAAAHLQQRCPTQRYALLEARDAPGGTWHTFRYPGVRSDSDMHTLGYAFKPWTGGQAMADGPAIQRYIEDTATERGIDRHIRLRHRVLRADWSSADARWTVLVEHDGAQQRLSARFLLLCAGYYNHAQGHRPPFPGEDTFSGRLVHPQAWPADLAHAGQRVVVIGSGATAVTLVPELAKTAAHVTLLQRSPSYVVNLPRHDALAQRLRRWLPAMWAYRLVRGKNIAQALFFFQLARRRPAQVKARLVALAAAQLGPDGDAATHFSPAYKPWDQRVCVAPDGDLFQALRSGRAEVVTDTIARFTPQGITLDSGRQLAADIIVSATGLQLNLLGDVAFSVDGRACDLSQALTYKGMMLSNLPNLAYTFGYTNASWTLKADLTAGYVCRLLNHMKRHGLAVATPLLPEGADMATRPFVDFTSGYVQRAAAMMPKQGVAAPWRLYQNYLLDLLTLRFGKLADGTLRLSSAASPPPA